MSDFDSMLELAIELMEKKRKPHTIQSIAKDVFEMKGLKVNENLETYSQFINDFMLCGLFICCGEDKKGVKVWDLKSRQKQEIMDKDGSFFDDPYGDYEDVIKHELKDEFEYLKESKQEYDDQYSDDSDEDDKEEDEKDDIEEELMLNEDYDEFDDVEEDDYDDPDDITITNKKKK